jgi:hypothetical protein
MTPATNGTQQSNLTQEPRLENSLQTFCTRQSHCEAVHSYGAAPSEWRTARCEAAFRIRSQWGALGDDRGIRHPPRHTPDHCGFGHSALPCG